jgi:hypothetical protein
LLAPGTTLVLAELPVLPVFLPPPAPKDATPWAILSWGSALLHGFSRCLRPRPLDREHLSWGFVAPTTLEEERVHVPCRLPVPGSLVVPGGPPADPTPPATVPLAGFPNLSAAFILSPPSRHFQTGGVRGVRPFRDLILPRSLDDSSPPTCPLDVPPIELALIPVLGGDARGHSDQCLGTFRPESLIVYRAFVLVEIDLRHRSMINDSMTDLSLLGFCLLMV